MVMSICVALLLTKLSSDDALNVNVLDTGSLNAVVPLTVVVPMFNVCPEIVNVDRYPVRSIDRQFPVVSSVMLADAAVATTSSDAVGTAPSTQDPVADQFVASVEI